MTRRGIASPTRLPGQGGVAPTAPSAGGPLQPPSYRGPGAWGQGGDTAPGETASGREGRRRAGSRAGYFAAGGLAALGTFSQSARNFLMPASVSGWLANWAMTL